MPRSMSAEPLTVTPALISIVAMPMRTRMPLNRWAMCAGVCKLGTAVAGMPAQAGCRRVQPKATSNVTLRRLTALNSGWKTLPACYTCGGLRHVVI